uniref:Uncharacterized protein n=1 Tax=Nelumbo nucifera TaxID=4432 RepID=A0A822ZR97_NELNU|nr:TPA_asm: hypothetical protein HUJ06_004271 [Nelumbo nucifera]
MFGGKKKEEDCLTLPFIGLMFWWAEKHQNIAIDANSDYT